MQEQKEKLENELRFLKDTLDAGLINEEEFAKEKERISAKLKEISSGEDKKEEEPVKSEEPPKAEPSQEEPVKTEVVPKEEPKPAEVEEKVSEEAPKVGEEVKAIDEQKVEPEAKPKNKWMRYTGIAVLFLILLIGFSFINSKETKNPEIRKNSVVEYKTAVKISMTIINDKNCEICSTDRIISTIKQLFPGVIEATLSFDEPDASNQLDEFGIESLPAYILDSAIENASNFAKFKTALIKKGDKYFINPSAAGSNYFFKRPQKPKSMELFLSEDASITKKAKDNLQEFLSTFQSEIDYREYIVKNDEKAKLKDELGITTFPAFLINNQYKIVGIFSGDSIKQYFCLFNELERCSLNLSREII